MTGKGWSPLSICLSLPAPELVKCLLDAGADPHGKTSFAITGYSLLHAAAKGSASYAVLVSHVFAQPIAHKDSKCSSTAMSTLTYAPPTYRASFLPLSGAKR